MISACFQRHICILYACLFSWSFRKGVLGSNDKVAEFEFQNFQSKFKSGFEYYGKFTAGKNDNGKFSERHQITKGDSKETIITITSDEPTLIGTPTNLNVTVHTTVTGNISISYYTYRPYRFKETETASRFYHFLIDSWKSVGRKVVYVNVHWKDQNGRVLLLGHNQTSVQVTEITCDIKVWQRGVEITNGTISLGNVTFVAELYDPNKLFRNATISTVWSFNDGTPLSLSQNTLIVHKYCKEGSYHVQVLAFIMHKQVQYVAKGSVFLKAESQVKYELVVWQGHGDSEPRVPSRDFCVVRGEVFFYIKMIDTFNILKGATFTYYWNFDGKQNVSSMNYTSHIYKTVGHKKVDVSIVAKVNGRIYTSTVQKILLVQDPIHSIVIHGKHNAEVGEESKFNVTCKGSAPVSFCWYISEGNCQLPQNVICSPTVLYKSCWSIIYHRFRFSGRFCVNVSVVNTVSFAHTQLQVRVRGLPADGKGHIVAIASTVPFIAVLILIIAIVLAIKHTKGIYYRRNKKRSETAKFDFRGSYVSIDQWSHSGRCRHYVICPGIPGISWPCVRVEEDDGDDNEEQVLFSDPSSPATPQRKTSYYGTIHMNLLQQNHNNPPQEDDDPLSRQNSLCHSV